MKTSSSHITPTGLLFKVALIGFLFLSFHPVADQQARSWKLKKEVNGIKVYMRTAEHSNLKELKTIKRYKTTLSNLVTLIADKESYTNWVYGCSKSYYLKRVKENESYHYQQTDAPWPVSDRDMIVHNVVTQDSITHIVYIHSTGLPDYIPAKESIVRVPKFSAYWKFTPLPNNEVETEYFMSLDPGGDLPDWVINLAVSEGPVRTLTNMQNLLENYHVSKNLSYIKD